MAKKIIVKIGQATSDERGKLTGGKVGDQTGKEVCISKYSYSKRKNAYNNWKFVARAKNKKDRKEIAKIMIDICKNDKIGYNQKPKGGRKSLYKKLKEVKFKVKNLKGKVDTSCTPVVQAAIAGAGIKIAQGSDAAHLEDRIKSTGAFTIFKDKKHISSYKHLQVGDILNSGRHTAVVVKIIHK